MAESNRAAASRTYGNTQLVAISLLIAIFVWILAKQNEFETNIINVPVYLVDVPAHLDSRVFPESLEVNIQYPRGLRGDLLGSNFAVQIDAGLVDLERHAKLPGQTPYVDTYSLKPGDFKVVDPSLPAEAFRLLLFDPESVQISTEYIGQTARVVPNWSGEPAEGYFQDREASQVVPSEVFLIGPRHSLDSLEDLTSGEFLVPTRPIKLSGARATTVVTVELVLPDGIRPLESDHRLVEATAAIVEERDTIALENVPIRISSASRLEPIIEPKTARVQVEGPKSLISMIDAAQISFRPETHYEERAGAVHNAVAIEGVVSPYTGSALESRRRELRVLSVEPSSVRIAFPSAPEPGVIAP